MLAGIDDGPRIKRKADVSNPADARAQAANDIGRDGSRILLPTFVVRLSTSDVKPTPAMMTTAMHAALLHIIGESFGR